MNWWLEFLLNNAIKATLVLIAAGVVSLALRQASAAARHLAWTSAVVWLLVLPVLSLIVPAWQISNSPVVPKGNAARQLTALPVSLAPAVEPANIPAPQYFWALSVWAAGVIAAMGRLFFGIGRVWWM